MNVIIKEIPLEHLDALLKLSRRTFINSYAHLNDPVNFQVFIDKRFNPERIRNEWENPSSSFFGMYKYNALIALLKVNLTPAQTNDRFPDSLEIERIYIQKEHKRNGYGKVLIDYAENLAKEHGISQIWLGVWSKNPAAIKFYEYCGFKKLGEHIFKVGNEEQIDFLFVKKL